MIGDRSERQRPRRRSSAAVALVLGVMAGAPGVQASAGNDPVAALRSEIEALRDEYEARIRRLESRLAELEAREAESRPREEPASEADELAALRAAARAAAGGETAPADPAPGPVPAVGGERNLNRLNPEISVTGIVVGNGTGDGREEFDAQEFELDVQSALDPFSKMRFTLAVGDEGVELEEGYLAYSSLPGGLELMAGKFRQRFGSLNRQHLHALPQSDYPLAYQAYFGDEGLGQTGVSLTWLLPRPWASANEITLEVTDGENETAFAGEEFEDFSFLGRVKNFWQLSDATYLEWGLSGITGKTAAGGDSEVWGTDLTLNWRPPGRAKYREITWRAELLSSRRDDPSGAAVDAVGGYAYLEGLLGRNLSAGIRFDRVEGFSTPGVYDRGVVPYLTWWQSEYVRLRAEYGLFELGPEGKSEDRFTLQLTWAAGPHKHESY